MRISVFALLFASAAAGEHVINSETTFNTASEAGRNLLQNARQLQNNGYYYGNQQGQQAAEGEEQQWQLDTSFLPNYSIKFQGCHHVQQWNEGADSEDDVKILTKRLVRFRLCPQSDCNNDLTGCSSNYGDYVVDLETFLSAYLGNQNNQNEGQRELQENDNSLAYCSAIDGGRRLQDENGNYYQDQALYTGPYCADQGGEIRMGVFQDDTCSVFASNGGSSYYSANGGSLPYSGSSIIGTQCMACGYGSFCETAYTYSGKCESKMNMGYRNEASCAYIDGIKIIREDGVIRTTTNRKSTTASVFIGLFLTGAVLLGGYVYYLRTKLARAKINLNAAGESLA